MHAGVVAQLRLHLVTAKPWQRALVALGLLVIGVAAGLLVLDGLGALLLVATATGWWREGVIVPAAGPTSVMCRAARTAPAAATAGAV